MMTTLNLEAGVRGQLDTCKRFHDFLFFSHSETLGPMIREIQGLFDMMSDLFDIKYVTWWPLFSKQGHNDSQASFPIHLHFMQI